LRRLISSEVQWPRPRLTIEVSCIQGIEVVRMGMPDEAAGSSLGCSVVRRRGRWWRVRSRAIGSGF
jgi:hypothetical protein